MKIKWLEIKWSDVGFWLFIPLVLIISKLISMNMTKYFSELDIHYFFSAVLQGFAALLTLSFMVMIFFIDKLETEMRYIRNECLQYLKGFLNMYSIPIWDTKKILDKEQDYFIEKRNDHKTRLEFKHSDKRSEDEEVKEGYMNLIRELDHEHKLFVNQMKKYEELEKRNRVLKRDAINPLVLMGMIVVLSLYFLPFGSFSGCVPEAFSSYVLFTILISSWSIAWLLATLIRALLIK